MHNPKVAVLFVQKSPPMGHKFYGNQHGNGGYSPSGSSSGSGATLTKYDPKAVKQQDDILGIEHKKDILDKENPYDAKKVVAAEREIAKNLGVLPGLKQSDSDNRKQQVWADPNGVTTVRGIRSHLVSLGYQKTGTAKMMGGNNVIESFRRPDMPNHRVSMEVSHRTRGGEKQWNVQVEVKASNPSHRG